MKDQIGKALAPVLAPFQEIDGCPLRSVWETVDGSDIEAIHLEFDSCFLTLAVDAGDDTIDISITQQWPAESECVADLRPWENQIGKLFGWGWVGVNQQGYVDTVSLSFGSVTPRFCITAVASSLRLCEIDNVITRQSKKSKVTKKEPLHFAKTA